jgi:hypothetical protein
MPDYSQLNEIPSHSINPKSENNYRKKEVIFNTLETRIVGDAYLITAILHV